MSELLQECRAPTRAMISNLINIELAFINTAHPDFVGANGVFANIVEQYMILIIFFFYDLSIN